MTKSDVCTLLEVTYRMDAYGVMRPEAARTKRFCKVRSASAQEFFEAGQQGIKPQYQITMLRAEYSGQQMVEYKKKRYAVYRTYEPNADEVELYLEERVNEQRDDNQG